jgi:hypothetical protein
MHRISLRGTGGCRGAPVLVVAVVVFLLFIVGVPFSVATVKTSTFEKCVITGAINYVKS